MYLYFDDKGILKEIVNDKALRQGSQDYNSIFIYWPSIETEVINSIWFRFVTQARRYQQVQLTPLSLTSSMKIPYSPKRDLKFFEYGKDYKFYEIKTTFNYQGEDKNVLSDYGTTSLSIYVTDAANEKRALGKVVFNVEESTEGNGEIQEDEYITLAQWNYLLKILGTAADDEFVVYQFRGSVDTYANLPSTDLEVGDTYNVIATGKNYTWDGEDWDEVVGIISTEGFVTIGGTQTISGDKKFTGDGEFTQSLKVSNLNPGEYDLILDKTGGTFRPKTDSTTYKSNLGSEDYRWGDIWLTGKLKDGTREFALSDIPVDSGLVHKSGTETITGTKTFSSIIYSDVSDITLIGKNGYVGIRAMSGDSVEGQINVYADGSNKAAHMFAKGSDNYYYGIKASKKGIEWEHPNSGGTQVEEDITKYPGIVNTTDNQTIGGNKTFSSGIITPSVSDGNITLTIAQILSANAAITGSTKCKITYDSKGLVTAGADLSSTDIPNLDAAKITSGTFEDARIASASTWNAKQDALVFDNTPTTGSNNPVKSQGIKSYIDTAVAGVGGRVTINSLTAMFWEDYDADENTIYLMRIDFPLHTLPNELFLFVSGGASVKIHKEYSSGEGDINYWISNYWSSRISVYSRTFNNSSSVITFELSSSTDYNYLKNAYETNGITSVVKAVACENYDGVIY